MEMSSSYEGLETVLGRIQKEKIKPLEGIQRELVWGKKDKTRLIETILGKMAFGKVYLWKDDSGNYQVVDGQQRLWTLYEYVNPEKPSITTMQYPDENRGQWAKKSSKRSGFKSFQDLSPQNKELFLSAKVDITELTGSKEDAGKQFRQLQYGKALKTGDILYASAISPWYEYVGRVAGSSAGEAIKEESHTRAAAWQFASVFFGVMLSDNYKMQSSLNVIEATLDFHSRKLGDSKKETLEKITVETNRLLDLAMQICPSLQIPSNVRWPVSKKLTVVYNLLFSVKGRVNKRHKDSIANIINEEFLNPLFNNLSSKNMPTAEKFKTSKNVYFGRSEIQELFQPLRDSIEANIPERDDVRVFNKNQREEILKADDFKCRKCGTSLFDKNWQADHIIPWQSGGPTETGNGQALCTPCHKNKTGSTLL